jgi:hypothetical protein
MVDFFNKIGILSMRRKFLRLFRKLRKGVWHKEVITDGVMLF